MNDADFMALLEELREAIAEVEAESLWLNRDESEAE